MESLLTSTPEKLRMHIYTCESLAVSYMGNVWIWPWAIFPQYVDGAFYPDGIIINTDIDMRQHRQHKQERKLSSLQKVMDINAFVNVMASFVMWYTMK